MPKGVYKHKGNRSIPSDIRRAIQAEYRVGGVTYHQLAAKHKISHATVLRIVHEQQAPTLPPAVPVASMPEPETLAVKTDKPATGRPVGSGGRWMEFKPQILALKAQGYSRSEISTKLAVPIANVAYYLYKQENKSQNEGVASNGHESLDTRFLVGFGCAELERTLTAIAARLGIAPALLRQGFSRFLGSTAVR